MTSPACYVIDAASWNDAMSSLAWAFLLCLAMIWAMSVDWWAFGDFVRRELRRRRLRRIRQGRAA